MNAIYCRKQRMDEYYLQWIAMYGRMLSRVDSTMWMSATCSGQQCVDTGSNVKIEMCG